MEEEKDIQKDLEECQKKCAEYLEGWKRERADFLNYKKDEAERIGMLAKYAKEGLILKVLPILDNIERAEEQLPEKLKRGEYGDPKAVEWTKGFLQIQSQVKEFLKKEGIEEIQALGNKFNPTTMEVVEEITQEGAESGIVIEELQKGYTMDGHILRVAKVKVVK